MTKARFSFSRFLSSTSLQLLALIVITRNRNYGSSLSTITFASAELGSQLASAATNLDYRYFLAGGICAATSHGFTTPIDVVKTRMQAEPERYREGVTSAALQILKEDGPSTLLGGLGPTVVGYGIEGAMKFGLYEVLKPVFGELLGQDREGLAFVLSSIVAGAVASIILCPLESTRIRIVTDPSYARTGLLVALPRLIREEGLVSTFSGVWAMLAKQVSFDILAQKFYAVIANVGAKAEDFKWIVSVDAAVFASIIACLLSQPGDVILTETYKRKSTKNVFMTVNDIYNNHGGIAGFFTGTSARILHVGLIITSQLVIYDVIKQLLGLPATGS
jgi:solute carrier family 25 phosphate transporter 3